MENTTEYKVRVERVGKRKPTTYKVRVEHWNTKKGNNTKSIKKVAVRNHLGQFHGATNYRGSVIS